MKLYTEYHLKEAYFKGLHNGENHIQGGYFDVQDFLTPIELPSDEEIEKTMIDQDIVRQQGYCHCFLEGAKWMKEQILNQNK